jgi:hypothetical protein
MKKIILLLLFVAGGWQHVHAQNFYAGGIFYDVTSPTTVQVGLQGQGVFGDKVIPSQVTYNSTVYTVTNIRDYAFINSTQLTSITIPNTVTNIGYRSFSNCNYVASFILPNSITSIGDEAFYACSSLTSFICNVTTPLTINQNVFGGLNQGVCALKVPASSIAAYQAAPVWQNFAPITCSNPPASFSFDGINYVVTSPTTVAVGNNAGASGSIVIPASVTTECGTYAVTSIGTNAFTDCVNLTAITIPNSVTSIGTDAFYSCSGLSSLIIPNSVTTIGGGAFNLCTGLTSVIIGNSVTSIGNYAFQTCLGLTSIIIPNSVTSIGTNAFYGCSYLASVTIPSSVTSIGDYAFQQCGLTSVICNIVAPLTINDTVFYGVNQSACSLIIPPGSVADYLTASVWNNFSIVCASYLIETTTVTACGSYTWEDQTYTVSGIYYGQTAFCITQKLDLTITTPPSSFSSGGINYVVTSPTTVAVGTNPSASGNLVIPASVTTACGTYAVTSMVNMAFYGCTGLTSVSIPNTITNIPDKAFKLCTGLASITISNSVTSIGFESFRDCSSLTSVTIPDSVTSIGVCAFLACTSLNSVTLSNALTSISDGVFKGCSGLTSIVIPESVTSIIGNAFHTCTNLASVTMPSSLTSIGGSAFFQCTNLTLVTCNAVIPPSTTLSSFIYVHQGSCLLLVPAGSMAAYQAAPVWQNFLFPIPTTIKSSQCGSVLATPNSDIECNPVPGALSYTFAITYNSITYTVVSSDSVIKLSEATGMPVNFNAAYAISVQVNYGVTDSTYGAVCTVSTPIYQTTQLSAVSCGATLASIGSLLYADINWNATGYRFKVINNTTGETQYVDNSHQWFALNWLTSYDYSTSYTVSVQLQIAGVWLGYYGTTCSVNTPIGSFQLSPSQCGATLPSIGTVIATTPVSGATGYRFRITDVTPGVTGSNLVQVKDRSYHWFTLPMLSRYNYGSTYMIEVAVKTTGGYTGYGSPCYVYTPAVPMLANCGAVVPTAGSLVYTTSTNSVTQYRFQVTNVATQQTVTFDTNKYWFSFRVNVPGFTVSSAYSVRISVMTAGTWSPFGDACEITSPAAAARTEEVSAFDMQVLAYPNPFTSEFKLNVTTSTEGTVELKVYDMLGKLVEAKSINIIDYISEDFGSSYPAGIYNVIVSQGEQTKTLRLIKR